MSDELTMLEVLAIIKVMRKHRSDVLEKYELLMGRLRTHGDGLTANAMHALDNELGILETVIVKLWKQYLSMRREPP